MKTKLLLITIAIWMLISCGTVTSDIPEISIEDSIAKVLDHVKLPKIPNDTINLIEFSGVVPDE